MPNPVSGMVGAGIGARIGIRTEIKAAGAPHYRTARRKTRE